MGGGLSKEEQQKRKEFTDYVSDKRISLLNRKPGDTMAKNELNFPNHLYISFFGEFGIGKTCLINSMMYALFGGLSSKYEQPIVKDFQGSLTRRRVKVSLTSHLSVIDYRALNAEVVKKDNVVNEVISHIEGNYQVGDIEWEATEGVRRIKSAEITYCTVLVFSAKNVNLASSYQSLIERLRQWQGCYPLAVITHVDQVSAVNVRRRLQSMGIDTIFEVANHTQDKKELEEETQKTVLDLLDKCFVKGDQVFYNRSEDEKGI